MLIKIRLFNVPVEFLGKSESDTKFEDLGIRVIFDINVN